MNERGPVYRNQVESLLPAFRENEEWGGNSEVGFRILDLGFWIWDLACLSIGASPSRPVPSPLPLFPSAIPNPQSAIQNPLWLLYPSIPFVTCTTFPQTLFIWPTTSTDNHATELATSKIS